MVEYGAASLRGLVRLLGQACKQMKRSHTTEQCSKLFRFFLVLFDYRLSRKEHHPSADEIEGMRGSSE